MAASRQLQAMHASRLGRAVLGLAELGLAFGLASFALNSGSLLQYALTIILLFMAGHSFAHALIPHKK